MACKTCGGTMVGDGYTLVRQCACAPRRSAGGAGPIYCTMSDEPESTEQKRVWHGGPPPYVGWWQASAIYSRRVWRWWNGEFWSLHATRRSDLNEVKRQSADKAISANILWNDYWPADARVPRLAPEDFEVGARWVCVKPLFTNDFVGMELRVSEIRAHTLQWKGPEYTHVSSLSMLPDEYYVPRRCIGPQTRWDFPMPKGSPVPDHMALLFEAYTFGQFADDFDRPLPLTVRAALRKHLDEQLDTRYVAQKAKDACHG